MTHDTAVESARTAASRYVYAWLARRRAYELLPAEGPGHDGDLIGCIRDATERAFDAYVESLVALYAAGGEVQAVALMLEVQDRTTAE